MYCDISGSSSVVGVNVRDSAAFVVAVVTSGGAILGLGRGVVDCCMVSVATFWGRCGATTWVRRAHG